MSETSPYSADDDILVIHPGGLGDVCISESTLLSLRTFFGHRMIAVGNERILRQFREYFLRIESIDSRKWGYLFSESGQGRDWRAIVLIGKDRDGSLRQRLSRITRDLIFIAMYPDDGATHGEDYQLKQLATRGIAPRKKRIRLVPGDRVIVYPEKAFRKAKWPVDSFVRVYERLKEEGLNPIMLRQQGLTIPSWDVDVSESLADVAGFFSGGGLFFSNDSGMAHFAARCGLRTLTLFCDANPTVWRPKNGVVLVTKKGSPTTEAAVNAILSLMGTASSASAPEERW